MDGHRLPAHRLGRDAAHRPAGRPARQGAADGDQPRRVPGRLGRRRSSRGTSARSSSSGRSRASAARSSRCSFAIIRDEFPRGAPERGDGPCVRRARRRRRRGHRGERPDRRQPLVALAVRGERRSSSPRPSSWCGASCPSRAVRAPASVDVWGAAHRSPAALSACWWASPRARTSAGRSPAVVGLFAGVRRAASWSGAGGAARGASPMVDMRMLARRVVLFTNLTAMLSGFALYMTWVILPTFYQLPQRASRTSSRTLADYGFGTTVTVAGLWMLPTSLSILVAGPLAGAARRPPRLARPARGRDGPGGDRLGRHRDLPRRALAARRSGSSSAASASASPSPSCRS